jgi:FkbM family methyltransferase
MRGHELGTATQKQTIFDQDRYLRHIQARGQSIREVVGTLQPLLGLATALDAGCGLGFFAQILKECGLDVRAFDGREANVAEARQRYPGISFDQGDVQDPRIARFGASDLVLCFGLLYHLESPLLAIRNLRELTGKALLLESMCLPEERPWMLLREEPSLDDQSLTDVAFYATEGCLAKMMYRAGFACVYRLVRLPDHDDFKDTPDHRRRRTVLLATTAPVEIPGFVLFPEPMETADPWAKPRGQFSFFGRAARRASRFAGRPAREKYVALALRFRRMFPRAAVPVRLPFGSWFLVGSSAVDNALLFGGFERAELRFVEKFLRPGMTVLDIGAHHGLYTLLASKRVGGAGKVVCFEPSPRERKQLSRNIKLNFCSNVTIETWALGAERSQADLYLPAGGEDGCNSLRPPNIAGTASTLGVQVTRLDDWLADHKLERVDFIKLDVEGGERDVLRGAEKLLERQPRPVIFAEVQDLRTEPWGYPAREIIEHLVQRNYKWFEIDADGGLQPLDVSAAKFDGNFVACPEERIAEVRPLAR